MILNLTLKSGSGGFTGDVTAPKSVRKSVPAVHPLISAPSAPMISTNETWARRSGWVKKGPS